LGNKNSFCSFLLFLSFLIAFSGFGISSPHKPRKTKDQKTLDVILKKTGDYCEKVKAMALFYVCREKVEDERHLFERRNLLKFSMSAIEEIKPRIRTKTYTYDYQLIKKGEVPKEKRTLLGEDGEEKYEEEIEFKPVKYSGTYMVYGPVGFLSKKWQKHFEYKIVGEDVIDNNKAIIIESTPKKEREANYNFGRVWVDEKDFSILKIEYDPRSIKDYEDELVQSPIGDLSKKVKWATHFGVEKNGVRFPSQQLIQEFYVNSEGESLLIEKIIFRYEDYKFFIVETEVIYN
jgi:outer membrane lipoprotein-sorting protein